MQFEEHRIELIAITNRQTSRKNPSILHLSRKSELLMVARACSSVRTVGFLHHVCSCEGRRLLMLALTCSRAACCLLCHVFYLCETELAALLCSLFCPCVIFFSSMTWRYEGGGQYGSEFRRHASLFCFSDGGNCTTAGFLFRGFDVGLTF